MSQMNVQIVTPDGLVYDHHAAFVSVKTIDGELGDFTSSYQYHCGFGCRPSKGSSCRR